MSPGGHAWVENLWRSMAAQAIQWILFASNASNTAPRLFAFTHMIMWEAWRFNHESDNPADPAAVISEPTALQVVEGVRARPESLLNQQANLAFLPCQFCGRSKALESTSFPVAEAVRFWMMQAGLWSNASCEESCTPVFWQVQSAGWTAHSQSDSRSEVEGREHG